MVPDYQTLVLPVLRVAAEGDSRVADVSERIPDELGLTQAEREELLPSGHQRLLHNRIHWAKLYMSKAELIASPARGRFVATEKGKALLASSPERIDVTLLMQEPEFRAFYINEAAAAEESGTYAKPAQGTSARITPEEQIDAAHAAPQSALRDDLLQRILVLIGTIGGPVWWTSQANRALVSSIMDMPQMRGNLVALTFNPG